MDMYIQSHAQKVRHFRYIARKIMKKGISKCGCKAPVNQLVSDLGAFRRHVGPHVVLELHLDAQERLNGLQIKPNMHQK